jgi:hypothetical protein
MPWSVPQSTTAHVDSSTPPPSGLPASLPAQVSLPEARWGHAAAALDAHRVVVAGGLTVDGAPAAPCVVDLLAQAVEPVEGPAPRGVGAQLVSLSGGAVIGLDGPGPERLLYTWTEDRFVVIGALPRSYEGVALLPHTDGSARLSATSGGGMVTLSVSPSGAVAPAAELLVAPRSNVLTAPEVILVVGGETEPQVPRTGHSCHYLPSTSSLIIIGGDRETPSAEIKRAVRQ